MMMTMMNSSNSNNSSVATARYDRYPAYRDSGVAWLGEAPAHWEVTRLKNTIRSCQNGLWGDEPDGLHDVVCVRVADFDRVSLRVDLAEPTYRSIDPSVVRERGILGDDLLIEKSGGGDNQPVGTVVSCNLDVPAICSNFVARITVAPGFASRFLTYLHASLYSQRIVIRHIKQNTGIQNLDSDSYFGEVVALPPLSEQRAIAAFLDRETARIDALIAKKERLIELLQEKRAAVITQAVTKGLDPTVPMKDSGVEWLGEVPAHWEVVHSKWLFALRNQRAFPGERQLTASQAYGIIPQDEFMALEGRRVVQVVTGAEILKHVEPNDFVISMRSFQGGLEWSKYAGAVSSAYVALIPSSHVGIEYFGYLFKSDGYIQALQSTTNLVRDGQALRYENFTQVDLPLPPISEQRRIARELDQAMTISRALEASVEKVIITLREYRSALISAAVTGKVDIREDDETADMG